MGKKKRVRYLSPERERAFPSLSRSNYEATSDETTKYNCIAYVAGDESQWWQPYIGDRPTYWPDGAIKGYSIEALVSAFRALGYTMCSGGELEPGFEKIALYVNANGEWAHAARQQADGSWLSKLGDWEDICHTTVEAVECDVYGKASRYMKRPIRKARSEKQRVGRHESQ